MSNARSCLVKRGMLTEVARTIRLDEYMSYGNGKTNLPSDSKVLSNMLEALIGAVYLDGGFRVVSRVVKSLFGPYFHEEKLRRKPQECPSGIFSRKWGGSSQVPSYEEGKRRLQHLRVRRQRAQGEGGGQEQAGGRAKGRDTPAETNPNLMIVPVFLPHFGCRQRCTYCNQNLITNDISEEHGLEAHSLVARRPQTPVEAALYGGNPLGLRRNLWNASSICSSHKEKRSPICACRQNREL